MKRGVAPRNNACDDEFISENKRNVKRKRVRRRGDIQRDCVVRDAS
jgi:hypothetical protein